MTRERGNMVDQINAEVDKATFIVREVSPHHRTILRQAAKARSMKMGDMLGQILEMYEATILHPEQTGREIMSAVGIEPVTR
tara:strand:+ start:2367 stop:2612 length:246 start_codon:yes stop_codon:yes gene_type:complete